MTALRPILLKKLTMSCDCKRSPVWAEFVIECATGVTEHFDRIQVGWILGSLSIVRPVRGNQRLSGSMCFDVQ